MQLPAGNLGVEEAFQLLSLAMRSMEKRKDKCYLSFLNIFNFFSVCSKRQYLGNKKVMKVGDYFNSLNNCKFVDKTIVYQ